MCKVKLKIKWACFEAFIGNSGGSDLYSPAEYACVLCWYKLYYLIM